MRRISKRSLTLILSLTLAFGLSMPVHAATMPLPDSLPFIPNTNQSLNPWTLDPSDLPAVPDYQTKAETSNALENWSDVKSLAATKAQNLIKFYGVSNVQYALIKDGTIMVTGGAGYSDRANRKTVKDNNLYCIASISKVYTTAAVMQLVDQGKINLDSPVTTYIPEFTMKDARYKNITVRMLLNHSAGLMGSSFNNALLLNDSDQYATDHLLASLKTQRLQADPGAYSVYCNDGFTLAELVVERVSGQSFTTYIKQHFADPLSLSSTKTPLDKFSRSLLAKTYANSKTTKADPPEFFNTIGAGGLYASASDVCRFATLFMSDSIQPDILSESSVMATKNQEYNKGLWPEGTDTTLAYGLGWDSVNAYPFSQYNIQALTKGGDSSYYHSSLIVLPEENMAMAVLTSGGSSSYNQLAAQEVLLGALKVSGSISAIKPNKTFESPVKAPMPASLTSYSGYYGTSSNLYKVDVKNGDLTLYYPSNPEYGLQRYTYTGNNEFTQNKTNGHGVISFVKETNGITYLKIASYSTAPYLGQTASYSYSAQKLKNRSISASVKKAWNARQGKRYFMVNEKYTSLSYYDYMPAMALNFKYSMPGYFGTASIIDKNNAQILLQIPGSGSRDLRDYRFYTSNKVEYMETGGFLYMREEGLKTLPTAAKFTSTLSSKGYAKYYKVGTKSAGKTITVKVPSKSAFMVYDKNRNTINNSYTSGKKTAKLPKGGYVCFVGKGKATFTIQYKK